MSIIWNINTINHVIFGVAAPQLVHLRQFAVRLPGGQNMM